MKPPCRFNTLARDDLAKLTAAQRQAHARLIYEVTSANAAARDQREHWTNLLAVARAAHGGRPSGYVVEHRARTLSKRRAEHAQRAYISWCREWHKNRPHVELDREAALRELRATDAALARAAEAALAARGGSSS